MKHTINKVKQSLGEWRAKQLLIGGGTGLLALAAVTGFGIYAFGWQGSIVGAISKVVPYPAAFVGTSVVSFSDYQAQHQQLDFYLRGLAKATPGYPMLNSKQVDADALNGVVGDYFVQTWADQHGLRVSSQEFRKAETDLFTQQGGEKAMLKLVHDQYGMSKGDFEAQLRTQLLRAKVQSAVAADAGLNAAAKDRANTLLKQAAAGADFAALARDNSQDGSAAQTGDKALVSAADLPVPVGLALANAKDGQLVTEVIAANHAYYVVRREKADSGGVPLGRIIVIHPASFETWLAGQLSKQKVTKLLPQTR